MANQGVAYSTWRAVALWNP